MTRPEPSPSRWVAPILWGAMVGCVLLYGLVAHLVRMAGPIAELGTVAGAFTAVSLVELLVQTWVWGRLDDDALFPRVLARVGPGRAGTAAFRVPATESTPDPIARGADAIRITRVASSLVVWALADSVGVFGLVLSLLAADPRWFYPFGVVALAELIFFFPRQDVEAEQIRRWIRYATMRGLAASGAAAVRPPHAGPSARAAERAAARRIGAGRVVVAAAVVSAVVTVAAIVASWWRTDFVREPVLVRVERTDEEVRVDRGAVRAIFAVGEPIDHVYRVLSMEAPEGPPFDFVAAELWGIPIERMPEDRPFLKEDFAKGEIFQLFAPTPDLAAKLTAVMGTNLGWKKVRIAGRLLVPKELSCQGAPIRGEFGRFVDLSDVDAVYDTP